MFLRTQLKSKKWKQLEASFQRGLLKTVALSWTLSGQQDQLSLYRPPSWQFYLQGQRPTLHYITQRGHMHDATGSIVLLQFLLYVIVRHYIGSFTTSVQKNQVSTRTMSLKEEFIKEELQSVIKRNITPSRIENCWIN